MNIIPYDFSGKTIRVFIDEHGNPWWVVKDACIVLGISNHKDAASSLDNDEKQLVGITDQSGKLRNTLVVNESGLYNLIFKSRKPEAKEFKRWITHDILPQIRKTGAYSVSPALPQNYKEALQHLLIQVEKNEKLLIEKDQLAAEKKALVPKALMFDVIGSSSGHYCLRDAAKILSIKPHTFTKWLRTNKILFYNGGKKNVPYQKYVENGWFEMKIVTGRNGFGAYEQVYITPLGVTEIGKSYNFMDL